MPLFFFGVIAEVRSDCDRRVSLERNEQNEQEYGGNDKRTENAKHQLRPLPDRRAASVARGSSETSQVLEKAGDCEVVAVQHACGGGGAEELGGLGGHGHGQGQVAGGFLGDTQILQGDAQAAT
jgi:hypothetical protein